MTRQELHQALASLPPELQIALAAGAAFVLAFSFGVPGVYVKGLVRHVGRPCHQR